MRMTANNSNTHASGQVDNSLPLRLERLIRRHDPELGRLLEKDYRLQIRQQRTLKWQDRYLLILGCVLLALMLLRSQTVEAAEPSGLELLGADAAARSALVLDTDIRVEVTGLLARVWVEQSFTNDALEWMEGVYRFPLPDNAAVDRLHIDVAGRILEGEIHEKQAARKTYQKARNAGQTTALVEKHDDNRFETRIANIGPGEDIAVRISFLMPVTYKDGFFSLRLPMTETARFNDAQTETMTPVANPQGARPTVVPQNPHDPGHGLNLELELVSTLELALVESRYHDIVVHPTSRGYHISLGRYERSERDFELVWSPQLGQAPDAGVTVWEDERGSFALLMVAPPIPEAIATLKREVVFVIDTSSSMRGDSINQARAALHEGLDQLNAGDRFNIIQFSNSASALFGDSVIADTSTLLTAHDYIDSLGASGGTNMLSALDLALSEPPINEHLKQVIFVTDGAVGNGKELFSRIRAILGDARLFTVGIGAAPNSYFMRKAAEAGRGTFTHIGKLTEVATEMGLLWERIQRPALADIDVDWGGPVELFPEQIPDLYAGEPLWVVARMDDLPNEVVVWGNLGGRPWKQTVAVIDRISNEAVGTLWAQAQVAALENLLVLGQPPQEIREAIVDLALDYQLLTRFTSMVAVDKTPVRFSNEKLHSERVRSLAPKSADQRPVAFANTAAGWEWQLLLALLTALVTYGLYRASTRPAKIRSHSHSTQSTPQGTR